VIQCPTTTEEWTAIAEQLEERWQYPHGCGALDGKHMVVTCPVGKALAKGSSANLQNHDANTPTASGTGIGNAVAPQPDSVVTVPAPDLLPQGMIMESGGY
jgi:trehalose-6-phosphatase